MDKNSTIASMYLQGTKFFEVFEITHDYLSKKPISFDISYGPAFLVNLSFSCEMYMKCLIYIHKQELKRGHDLLDLFSKLNKEVKDSIQTIYSRHIVDLGYLHLVNFDVQIQQHRDVFMDWRYFYDSNSKPNIPGADYNFLRIFSLSLRTIVDQNMYQYTDIYSK